MRKKKRREEEKAAKEAAKEAVKYGDLGKAARLVGLPLPGFEVLAMVRRRLCGGRGAAGGGGGGDGGGGDGGGGSGTGGDGGDGGRGDRISFDFGPQIYSDEEDSGTDEEPCD